MEDIEKAIKKISMDHGQVEEWEPELTDEEWQELNRLHELQQQNEA